MLKDLGLNTKDLEPCKYAGGETEALGRLSEKVSMVNAKWVRAFEKPNTSPNSLEVYRLLTSSNPFLCAP